MASAEREPIIGSKSLAPSGGPGGRAPTVLAPTPLRPSVTPAFGA